MKLDFQKTMKLSRKELKLKLDTAVATLNKIEVEYEKCKTEVDFLRQNWAKISPTYIKRERDYNRCVKLVKELSKIIKNIEGGSNWVRGMLYEKTTTPHISWGIKKDCYYYKPSFSQEDWVNIVSLFNKLLKTTSDTYFFANYI